MEPDLVWQRGWHGCKYILFGYMEAEGVDPQSPKPEPRDPGEGKEPKGTLGSKFPGLGFPLKGSFMGLGRLGSRENKGLWGCFVLEPLST